MCAVAVFQSSVPQVIESQSRRPVNAVGTVTISPEDQGDPPAVGPGALRDPGHLGETGYGGERVSPDRCVRQRRMDRMTWKPPPEIAELHRPGI
jgi:hypothetical protein